MIHGFEIAPARLAEAGEVTIQWRTSGATSLELLQGDQAIEPDDPGIARGSALVWLDETATFTLVATGASGASVTSSRTVTVDVAPAPSIAEFTAPEVVQADEAGQATATLRWAGVENATGLTLEAPGRAPIELDPRSAEGSLIVQLSEETTFELVAASEVGTFSLEATVRIASLPVISRFEAERTLVGSGEANLVRWVTSGAAYVELWQDGEKVPAAPNTPEGSHEVIFIFPSTLELRAFNELEAMATATLEVGVGSPMVLDLQLSSTSLWLGEETTLSWRTRGGSDLRITLDESGEAICEVDAYAAIETSSCGWQPLDPGVYPLTLTVSNLNGVATDFAEVFASAGPLITRFDANPRIYTAGEDLELGWAVLGDPAGNAPQLLLTDDHGTTYETDAATGSLVAALHEPGTYRLELQATTDHPRSSPDRRVIELLVHPRPTVQFTATPPHFDDSVDDEVVLSWFTQDAETVVLYRLVDGSPVQVLEALDAEREAGSYSFVPEEEERFLLVATNQIGGSTSREVEVTLAPLEVLVVESTPDAFAQGQEILLRWVARMADEVTIDAATKRYLLEETAAPYLDLPAIGGSRLPLTDACGSVNAQGCAQISLPDGFTFPFGDDVYSDLWVYTTGYISLTHGIRPDAIAANETFPTDARFSGISLAPFWDSLAWDPLRYPAGNVYTALLEEGGARVFVIQWRDIGYANSLLHWQNASFNFEVALHEDGRFDFRYGDQRSGDTSIPLDLLGGASATIGFQLPDQSDAGVISFDGEPSLNGSQAHRTFSFRPLPPLPLIGDLRFSPLGRQGDFPITVTASRDGKSHSKSVMVKVARKPIVNLTEDSLAPVPAGNEFLVGWTSSNASSLVVIDDLGAIRCTAPNQAQINEGLCALSESSAGRHRYIVRATGAHGVESERELFVDVFGDFGVNSFFADSNSIEKGSDIQLHWKTLDAASIAILADGTEIYREDGGASVGSFLATNLQKETEYTLVVTNHLGVTEEATLVVSLWDVTIGLQPSTTSVRPGDPITVSIDAREVDGGAPVSVYGRLPLAEVPSPVDRYLDISGFEQVVNHHIIQANSTTIVNIQLPEGFSFPYMGAEYTALRAFVHGYVSFNPTATAFGNNASFPTTRGQGANVHLAPFWDNLHPRGVGQIHSARLSEDTFAIQWSRMSMTVGSTDPFPHNLNFQLVLHRDGAFEYRYGTMEPHPTNRPPNCYPNDCTHEVSGSAATIGYQGVGEAPWFNYHFGGLNPGADNPIVAGGLGGRTLRYPATVGSGTFTFHPQHSDVFTFCVDRQETTRCKDLQVDASFALTASLSRAEIAYGEPVTLSWQGVGGKVLNVFEGGALIHTTSVPAEVDRGSTILNPSSTTTYDLELLAGNRRLTDRKVVDVERFSISASATPSTGPGSPITVSWDLRTGAPGLGIHVAAPMVEISNEDFHLYDISLADDVITLMGPNVENANIELPFDAFTFPFFGTEHSSIRVATDGYLTWETVASVPGNQPIPNSVGSLHTKALAPFWEDLNTRPGGRVIAKKIDADRYVIQWSHVSLRFGSSDFNQGDLNFLVVLHRDGSFEYRFGSMHAPALPGSPTDCYPATCEMETNGSSATIGYQAPGGVGGYQLHFGGSAPGPGQLPIAGGLSYRAWRFTPHTATGPGSATIVPSDSGILRVCAYDPVLAETSCAPTLPVDVPWGVDFFQANPAAPLAGQPLTLSWSVRNLESLHLFADGSELVSFHAPNIPLLGTHGHTPTGTTTYVLEGHSKGRVVTREVVARHRAFDLQLTGPSGTFFPGEVVEVDWTLTPHLPGDPILLAPMSEIPAGPGQEGAFLDLSEVPGAEQVTLSGNSGSATVTIPFSFPYLGTQQTSLVVFIDGYLSFSGFGGNGNGANVGFPASAGTQDRVHLAPFWDDMILRGGDSIWRHAPDADTLIIQWRQVSLAQASNANNRYNLNFQVVLRSNGVFEYRYGLMEPPAPPFSHASCRPSSCVNEANGSSATIGYQSLDATFGYNLHIGVLAPAVEPELGIGDPVPPNDSYLAFPGGLSHRAFRYVPNLVGKARVVVGRTGDQTICAALGEYAECKSLRLNAIANSGELIISELMIDPAAGSSGQWVEIRNLSTRSIDLQGFLLRSALGSHLISAPLPVPPGGFATLASSSDVPFTPDYIHGGELVLSHVIDSLELIAGGAGIHRVSWGAGWEIPPNEALSLDPGFHKAGLPDSSDFSTWCSAGATGSPGALGDGCLNPWYVADLVSTRPFLDIASTGTRFYDVERANGLARLPSTGFQATLFGEHHGRFWVSANGWMSLADALPTATPGSPTPTVPRSVPAASLLRGPLIAPFWTFLSCGDTCQVLYERRVEAGEDLLIIQWQDFGVGAGAGSMTFQVQLWASGEVVIAFREVDNPHPAGSPNWALYEGNGSWIGIEGKEPSTYLNAHDKRPLGLDRRSIHFQPK